MTEIIRPRKEIELTVRVYVEMERNVLDDEQPARVLGAGGQHGMAWPKFVGALARLGCKVNEHWHSADLTNPIGEKRLVVPASAELAEVMRERGQ